METNLGYCQKLNIRQRQNVWQYFNGLSTAFKIACSSPRLTWDFVRKGLFCVFNESTSNSKDYLLA